MKRFLLLSSVVVFLPCQIVHSQLAVFDAAVSTIMEKTHFDQVIHYAQMIDQAINQVNLIKNQIEHAVYMANMAVQNLTSADINSFDDFMDWYNRQLYLERMTVESFKNMNVTIGKKNYNFMDIEGMAGGFNETYIEYWNNEFTEEQRKEMWLTLGLTPSNYAYVQPFRERGRELAREFLAASSIRNNEYMKNMQANNLRQDKLARDKYLGLEEKMGEKEVLMMILESSMENNKVLNDIAMYQAMEMERKAVEMYMDQTPMQEPQFSSWPENGFRPLTRK
jgi:hypothetical protein